MIRIRTTGGGGWGDPLERPYDEVVRDCCWGKVSVEGAERDYGVVLAKDWDGSDGSPEVDAAASDAERERRRAARTGERAVLRPRPRLRAARRGPGRGRRRLGLSRSQDPELEPEDVRAGRREVVGPAPADQHREARDGVEVGRRTDQGVEPGGERVVEPGEVRAAGQPSHARPHVVEPGAVPSSPSSAVRSAWSGWAAAARATPVMVARRACQQLAGRASSSGGSATAAAGSRTDGAVAVPHLDPALHLERDQGAAEGGSADAEVLGEPALGRQPVAGGEALCLDEVGDVVGQLLVQPGTRSCASGCRARAVRPTLVPRPLTIGHVAKRLGH